MSIDIENYKNRLHLLLGVVFPDNGLPKACGLRISPRELAALKIMQELYVERVVTGPCFLGYFQPNVKGRAYLQQRRAEDLSMLSLFFHLVYEMESSLRPV